MVRMDAYAVPVKTSLVEHAQMSYLDASNPQCGWVPQVYNDIKRRAKIWANYMCFEMLEDRFSQMEAFMKKCTVIQECEWCEVRLLTLSRKTALTLLDDLDLPR